MKNFPEQDQFNELEKRLQGYTEEPDELVWQNINKALRPGRRIFWFPWIDRLSTVVAVGLVGVFINFDSAKELRVNGAIKSETTTSISDDKTAEESTLSDVSDNALQKQMKSDTDLNQPSKQFAESKNAFESKHKEDISEINGPSIRKKSELLNRAKKHFPTDVIELANSEKSSDSNNDDGGKSDAASFSNSLKGASGDIRKLDSETDDTIDSLVMPQQAKQDSMSQKESAPAESKRKISKRRMTFYGSLTPQLSFQRVVPTSNDGIVINDVNTESIFSSDRFGFSIDAGLQGSITKRLEYYGGLSLHQQKQVLRYSYQFEGKTILEQDGDKSYMVIPETKTATIQYRMLNVGANVGLLYNLQGRKLTHKLGAGLSYQQGVNEGSTERYNNAESSYLFYQIFYRNEVRVGPRLRVYVQPAFSHSLYTNEKLDAPFTLKPYRAGIGFGILYDF